MIGGDVSIVTDKGDVVEVQVVGRGCERYDRLAVKVKKEGRWREIRPGDSIWWQSSWVFWTPRGGHLPDNARCGRDYDIKIARAGYSYKPLAGKP